MPLQIISVGIRSPGCWPSPKRILLVLYSVVGLSDRIVLIFQRFYFTISSYASSLWSQGLLSPPFKVIPPVCAPSLNSFCLTSLRIPHLSLPCPQTLLVQYLFLLTNLWTSRAHYPTSFLQCFIIPHTQIPFLLSIARS